MGALIVVLLLGGGAFFLASFAGGFGGAIAARGREDRSLLANAFIGFFGWLLAGTLLSARSGEWPEEMTVAWLGLTLACSVAIAWLLDRRDSRRNMADPKRLDTGLAHR